MKKDILKAVVSLLGLLLIASCGGGMSNTDGAPISDLSDPGDASSAPSPAPNEEENTDVKIAFGVINGEKVGKLLDLVFNNDINKDNNDDNNNADGDDGDRLDLPLYFSQPLVFIAKPAKLCQYDDNSKAWWLVYQMTGGLVDYAEIDFGDGMSKKINGNTVWKFEATARESDDIVMQLITVSGPLETYSSSNYSIMTHSLTYRYYDLVYKDPLFGNVTVNGEVSCKGRLAHYSTSGYELDNYTCVVSQDKGLTVSFTSAPGETEVGFDVLKKFTGVMGDSALKNYTISGDVTMSDGSVHKDIKLNGHLAEEVSGCVAN